MTILRFFENRAPALFTNKPNENNELKPITTVFIDHVLPKIDLEIEHVLIGVENRCRFSESKIRVVFAWHTFRKSVPIFDSENRRRFSTPCVFSLRDERTDPLSVRTFVSLSAVPVNPNRNPKPHITIFWPRIVCWLYDFYMATTTIKLVYIGVPPC